MNQDHLPLPNPGEDGDPSLSLRAIQPKMMIQLNPVARDGRELPSAKRALGV
jgi:hypothetical protein